MPQNDVGVVVVHYFRETDLARLLATLRAEHGVAAESLVVVNNGGDDGLLSALRPGVGRWLDLPNPGYGAAVNAGVDALPVSCTKVLVLTHEAELQQGAIETLAARLESNDSVGVVGPLLLRAGGDRIWSAGGVQSPVRGMPRHLRAGQAERPLRPTEVDWLDGSCVMMRTRQFLSLGGLDERYFLYFEDVDLGWRCRSVLGLAVECVPEAIASQSPGGHLDQFLATRNLLWLLRRQRRWLGVALFVGESLARLALGTIFKPRGSRDRQGRRWAGLRAGLEVQRRS